MQSSSGAGADRTLTLEGSAERADASLGVRKGARPRPAPGCRAGTVTACALAYGVPRAADGIASLPDSFIHFDAVLAGFDHAEGPCATGAGGITIGRARRIVALVGVEFVEVDPGVGGGAAIRNSRSVRRNENAVGADRVRRDAVRAVCTLGVHWRIRFLSESNTVDDCGPRQSSVEHAIVGRIDIRSIRAVKPADQHVCRVVAVFEVQRGNEVRGGVDRRNAGMIEDDRPLGHKEVAVRGDGESREFGDALDKPGVAGLGSVQIVTDHDVGQSVERLCGGAIVVDFKELVVIGASLLATNFIDLQSGVNRRAGSGAGDVFAQEDLAGALTGASKRLRARRTRTARADDGLTRISRRTGGAGPIEGAARGITSR